MKKTTVLFTLIFTVMILTASAMGLYKKNSIEKL
jgi:preprotein translocase subunit SecG